MRLLSFILIISQLCSGVGLRAMDVPSKPEGEHQKGNEEPTAKGKGTTGPQPKGKPQQGYLFETKPESQISQTLSSSSLLKPSEKYQQMDELKKQIAKGKDQIQASYKVGKFEGDKVVFDITENYKQLFKLYNDNLVLDDQHLSNVNWNSLTYDAQQQCVSFAQFIKGNFVDSATVNAFTQWLKSQAKNMKGFTLDDKISLLTALVELEPDSPIHTPDFFNYELQLIESLNTQYIKTRVDALKVRADNQKAILINGLNISISGELNNFDEQVKQHNDAVASAIADRIMKDYEILLAVYDPAFEFSKDFFNATQWKNLNLEVRKTCLDVAKFMEKANKLITPKTLPKSDLTSKIIMFTLWIENQASNISQLLPDDKLLLLSTLEKVEQNSTKLVNCKLDIFDILMQAKEDATEEEQSSLDQVIFERADELIVKFCQEIPTNRFSSIISIYADGLSQKIKDITFSQSPLVGRATLINAAFLQISDAAQILMEGGLWDTLSKLEQQQNPQMQQIIMNIKLMLPEAMKQIAVSKDVATFNQYMQGFFNRQSLAEIKVIHPQTLAQIQEGLATSLLADVDKALTSGLQQRQAQDIVQLNNAMVMNRVISCLNEAEKQYRTAASAEQDSNIAADYIKRANGVATQTQKIIYDQKYKSLLDLASTLEVNQAISSGPQNVITALNIFTPKQVNAAVGALTGTGEFRDQFDKLLQDINKKDTKMSSKIIPIVTLTILVPVVLAALLIMSLQNKNQRKAIQQR